MTVETHEIIFSFDQPGDARNPLLLMLRQLLNRPTEKTSRALALLGAQKVLIVDSQQGRAQYVAQLLSSAGYWPFVAPTSLDAYTLFLQGTFHPCVIILCEESAANNQFFLTRLSQQFWQRYDWNIPFIRLQYPSTRPLQGHLTDPLAYVQPTFARPTFSSEQARPMQAFAPLQPPRTPLSQSGEPTTHGSFPSSSSEQAWSAQIFPPLQPPHAPLSQYGEPTTHASFSSSSSEQAWSAQVFPPLQPPHAPLSQSGEPTTHASFSPSLNFQHFVTPSALQTEPMMPKMSTPLHTQHLQTEVPATTPDPVTQGIRRRRQVAPLPSATVMKFTKKQDEKISLDGLSIGRYQLQTLIGGNPIGDVYITYDRLREQNIALKTIQTNMIPPHLMEDLEEDYNLFQQELDLLQHTEHPHISRVMNIGKSYISGFPFIYKTMPYYAEGSLATWLEQFNGRSYAPLEVLHIIGQIADALRFLHEHGLFYQNFKQTNILVMNKTEHMHNLHVVLTDLPFVRDVINLPKTIESFQYFAPEQWEGESFTSSDQYGLAVLAYELLTGRPPFQGNSKEIMRRMHLTMQPPALNSINRSISPFLDQVIQRALNKQPEKRFESIRAFVSAFERFSN